MGEMDGRDSKRTVELFGCAVTTTSKPKSDDLVLRSWSITQNDFIEEENVDSLNPNSLLFSNYMKKEDSLDVTNYEEGPSIQTISTKGSSLEGNVSTKDGSLEGKTSCGFFVSNFCNEKNLDNGDDSADVDKVDTYQSNLILCSSPARRDFPSEHRTNEVNIVCFRILKKEISFGVTRGSTATNTDKTYESKVDHGMSVEDNADSLPSCIASVEKVESSEATTVEVCLDDATNLKSSSKGMSIDSITSNKTCLANKDCTEPANSTARKVAIPRSSIYHGVTRHRWSGKYEAHLWDNTCRLEGQRHKGKQAARVYDVAALKYWGIGTKLNFQKELEDIKNMTREECVTYVRRRSSCFSRGASVYRGVTRRQKDGRWQARIGRVAGNKDIYLGTFRTEEEAAEAYDIAAIKLCGTNVVTNFHISNYCEKGLGQLEDEGRVLGGISPSQLKL
ncbi:AP2 [Musa troglodytarum]|uniref:AP2 n=1 Tax=Musa troglodytarum TaxID=320322 RepID=A0A9E7KDY9_9LILI|nr:AP2 [Musa troglodytarum]